MEADVKRDELISLLQSLPEDAEIVTVSGDGILGDYYYSTLLSVDESEGLEDGRGTIWTKYSNYAGFGKKKVKVWEIR